MAVMPMEQLDVFAMPSTAIVVKRVLYNKDYLSNQYQASINEIYERLFKLFRKYSFHFACGKEVACL